MYIHFINGCISNYYTNFIKINETKITVQAGSLKTRSQNTIINLAPTNINFLKLDEGTMEDSVSAGQSDSPIHQTPSTTGTVKMPPDQSAF